jgi:pimeloyl-ACP methyl ester carboxylesterase
MIKLVLKIVGVLLIATAIAIPLSKAPDRPVESLVARWAPPPSDFIDVKGQLVHLRDEGPRDDPVPIVLIHGTSASLHTWEGWVQALKAQRRVISFDLPGFGLTGPFAGQYTPDDYRGDTYARFVIDLLDKLQVQRAVVGGNSLGGEVAWRLALMAPQRVDKLILVDAAGPAFTPATTPLGFGVAHVPALRFIAESLLPRPLVASTVASLYGDPRRITSELVDRYFELTLREGNRRALGHRLQAMGITIDGLRVTVKLEGAERIGTLTQPTLILWGELDRLIPLSAGRDFERAIAGSRLVIFDGLGHMPHEEDPARTVLPVKAFLGLR